jgi:RNA polymerase sigma factor (sigma-70 family)
MRPLRVVVLVAKKVENHPTYRVGYGSSRRRKEHIEMGTVVKLPYDEARHAVIDPSGDIHDAVIINFDKARLRRALRVLSAAEWQVIKRRYGFGGLELTVREVAKEMGVSSTTVWRLEQRALERLREHFGVSDDRLRNDDRLRRAA